MKHTFLIWSVKANILAGVIVKPRSEQKLDNERGFVSQLFEKFREG